MGSRNGIQKTNAVLELATAAAIAVFVFHPEPIAVVALGGWSLLAGRLQLAVGLVRRRQFGCQCAMMLSGSQSNPAGDFYIAGGLAMTVHPSGLIVADEMLKQRWGLRGDD